MLFLLFYSVSTEHKLHYEGSQVVFWKKVRFCEFCHFLAKFAKKMQKVPNKNFEPWNYEQFFSEKFFRNFVILVVNHSQNFLFLAIFWKHSVFCCAENFAKMTNIFAHVNLLMYWDYFRIWLFFSYLWYWQSYN